MLYLKFLRVKRFGYFEFFSLGFNNFKKAWGVFLNIVLKMIVPILVLIVAYVLLIVVGLGAYNMGINGTNSINSISTSVGIISLIVPVVCLAVYIWIFVRSLLYVLANFIVFDNIEISTKEAVKNSENLMKGNRGNYFLLILTFIGWAILAILTLGIGMFWLIPYMSLSQMVFYKSLTEKN